MRDVPDDAHYQLVVDAILKGRLIPFLGAGVNLAERTRDQPRTPDQLPSGAELAEYLAPTGYPESEASNLSGVAMYVDVAQGPGPLYLKLREVFVANYAPNLVHRFLARLPELARARGRPCPLMITTNYDDALEQAFEARGEPYDLVYYEAGRGEHHGKLWHRPANSDDFKPIDTPNTYVEFDPERFSVILKIHGAVNRRDESRDSYLITEDDYIDYIATGMLSDLKSLVGQLADHHCLFMGYSLKDWNVRVLLRRLWTARKLSWASWAIQSPDPPPGAYSIEADLWERRGVKLIFAPLAEYVRELDARLPDAGPGDH